MKITELTGYKDKGYFPVAKHVFRNAPVGKSMELDYYAKHQFDIWDEFMKKHGFIVLGRGEFGIF